jgi:hypothetical protein
MLLRAAPEKGRHDFLWLAANALCRRLGEDDARAFLRPLAKVLLADREKDARGELDRLVARAA